MPPSYILLWQRHLAVISRNSLTDKRGNHTTHAEVSLTVVAYKYISKLNLKNF